MELLAQQFLELGFPFTSSLLFPSPCILKLCPRISSPLIPWNNLTGLLVSVLNGILVCFHWGDDMQVGGNLYIKVTENTWRGAGRIIEETWTSPVRHIQLSTCLSKGEIFWFNADFNIADFIIDEDDVCIYSQIFITKSLKCDRLHSMYHRKKILMWLGNIQ